ncbi:hypothetical protein [Chondrinema litorale]|uniref:hypothetical protein n=1 Tax=Chondrinema litorale TaxID=2994555 RepID=UPI002543AD27|nr:hypothetical protein [Chondrinema litorale]UZR98151.1 hypothetical protein OQ292_29575 [Chondrinema litorale]
MFHDIFAPKLYPISYIVLVMLVSNSLKAQDLIPLKLDNYWVYEQKTIYYDGSEEIDTITNSIKEVLKFNNQDWYVLNEFGDDFTVRNTAEGQVELDTFATDQKGNYEEILFYKKPDKTQDLEYITYEVNHIKVYKGVEKIKTPVGKFKCHKYEIITEDMPNEKIETYISVGTGIIYQKWTQKDAIVFSTLIDFKIK